jgi:hypothetical protein
MKMTLTWVCFFCCLTACNTNRKNSDKISGLQTDKDSTVKANFAHHFHILDSIVNANINDTVYVGASPSIEFLEVNTGIEAHSDGTLIGKITFSKGDLKRWHDWYNKKYKKDN